MSFTFPQQGSNLPLWATTSTSLLKSHTGATQALTGARESWFVCLKNEFVHIYGFFSVFGLWHKANSVFTSPKFPPIFQNKNFDLQLFFFRVNITHHEGDFFCFVSCVLQDVSISMKVSGIRLGYFVPDQKWIGYTTLAHLVVEKMRNSEKDA